MGTIDMQICGFRIFDAKGFSVSKYYVVAWGGAPNIRWPGTNFSNLITHSASDWFKTDKKLMFQLVWDNEHYKSEYLGLKSRNSNFQK